MRRPKSAFGQDLCIEFRRSRMLMMLSSAAHAGAVVCVAVSGVPRWAAAILICILALGFLAEFRAYRRDHREQPLRYVLDSGDRWRCIRPDGTAVHLRVRGDPFVQPWLVVLRLTDGRRRHTLVLTADNCHPDTLRRLRVRLRYPLADPEPAR
jgi:hypothetical protein